MVHRFVAVDTNPKEANTEYGLPTGFLHPDEITDEPYLADIEDADREPADSDLECQHKRPHSKEYLPADTVTSSDKEACGCCEVAMLCAEHGSHIRRARNVWRKRRKQLQDVLQSSNCSDSEYWDPKGLETTKHSPTRNFAEHLIAEEKRKVRGSEAQRWEVLQSVYALEMNSDCDGKTQYREVSDGWHANAWLTCVCIVVRARRHCWRTLSNTN
jgi:hypothetical protein